MSNPNLSSLIFICLMIVSSQPIFTCMADESNEAVLPRTMDLVGFRHRLLLGTSKDDNPRKTLNIPPIIGVQWDSEDGKSQSPINIDVKSAQDTPGDLKRAYLDAPALLINGVNNIGVVWQGDAGGIEVNGSKYKLIQCHWHTPSEHTINRKKFDAELHLVHSNDKGQKAVVGILQNIGAPDPFIGNLTEKIDVLDTNGEIVLEK